MFCAATFLGVLFGVSTLNHYLQSRGNSPSSEVPFPFAVLFLAYVVLFLTTWVWFGRRLPNAGRPRWVAALVGAGSLFVFSGIGFLGAAAALIWSLFDPEQVPVASVFVLGGISTLILPAGITCVVLTFWSSGPDHSLPRSRIP